MSKTQSFFSVKCFCGAVNPLAAPDELRCCPECGRRVDSSYRPLPRVIPAPGTTSPFLAALNGEPERRRGNTAAFLAALTGE